MRVAADGGRLFWEDFEKRVIGHLTEEHKALKHARDKSNFWQCQYHKQRKVLVNVHEDEFGFEKLSICESCEEYFLFEGENDEHFVCDCGSKLCGDQSGMDWCCAFSCQKCDNAFCIDCGTFCEQCQYFYCKSCAPDNIEVQVHGQESGIKYCSMSCKEAATPATEKN